MRRAILPRLYFWECNDNHDKYCTAINEPAAIHIPDSCHFLIQLKVGCLSCHSRVISFGWTIGSHAKPVPQRVEVVEVEAPGILECKKYHGCKYSMKQYNNNLKKFTNLKCFYQWDSCDYFFEMVCFLLNYEFSVNDLWANRITNGKNRQLSDTIG